MHTIRKHVAPTEMYSFVIGAFMQLKGEHGGLMCVFSGVHRRGTGLLSLVEGLVISVQAAL